MSNVEKFNILTSRVLGHLYAKFPIQTTLYCSDFGFINALDEFLSNESDTDIKDTAEVLFFDETLAWLINNDIISAKQNGAGSFYDAVLTTKGLALLKKTPKGINQSAKSYGDYFVGLSKNIAKSDTDELVKILMRSFFG